jgi:hypothetical protein
MVDLPEADSPVNQTARAVCPIRRALSSFVISNEFHVTFADLGGEYRIIPAPAVSFAARPARMKQPDSARSFPRM